jgi:hypothetical protein
MKAHEHIVSGHHAAAVSDMRKWIAAIGDIAEQIQEVRKGSFRAEYKLFLAKTRLLSLRKRIEERAAAPEPPPDGLERMSGENGPLPDADLDKLLVRLFVPGTYLRPSGDVARVFFLEYYTDDGGLVLRDIDTREEYYAAVHDFAGVADHWETVSESEVYPDEEEDCE